MGVQGPLDSRRVHRRVLRHLRRFLVFRPDPGATLRTSLLLPARPRSVRREVCEQGVKKGTREGVRAGSGERLFDEGLTQGGSRSGVEGLMGVLGDRGGSVVDEGSGQTRGDTGDRGRTEGAVSGPVAGTIHGRAEDGDEEGGRQVSILSISYSVNGRSPYTESTKTPKPPSTTHTTSTDSTPRPLSHPSEYRGPPSPDKALWVP